MGFMILRGGKESNFSRELVNGSDSWVSSVPDEISEGAGD